ncbi:MAG: copper amine oxidase N-terminal domain-containing protein [Defluviitaleaceae bacterium]|nr:copper amine oxidase N-terminal domain-containing protein [Defluviitaleaceae bacterium]
MKKFLQIFLAVILSAFIFSATVVDASEFNASDVLLTINGEILEFSDQLPVEINGRIYLPARDIFEALGYNVSWSEEYNAVLITNGETAIVLPVGEAQDLGGRISMGHYIINGTEILLWSHPRLINDRAMLPMHRILEGLYYSLIWDVGLNTINITKAAVIETDTREIIYSLAQDPNLRNITTDTNFTNLVADFVYLWFENAEVAFYAQPWVNTQLTFSQGSIYVTERRDLVHGLAIRPYPLGLRLGETYVLEITGRATSPVPDNTVMRLSLLNMVAGVTIGVYAEISNENPNFTLTLNITEPETPDYITNDWWNETRWYRDMIEAADSALTSWWTWLTIMTNKEGENMSYAIDSIELWRVTP